MNRKEEVLTILAEECGELIQAAIKVIRFGADECPPNSEEPNKTQLEREMGDVLAMMRLADEEVGLDLDRIIGFADAKLVKVEKFMRNPRNDG